MRTFFLSLSLIAAASNLLAVPVISNIHADNISHSDATVHWDMAAFSWSNPNFRIRWTSNGSDCSGGSGGTVQISQYFDPAGKLYRDADMRLILTGLPAATHIKACVEAANNNDGNWSTGAQGEFDTLALPAVHPAIPAKPVIYHPSYPDTTGYAEVHITIGAGGDCSQLQAEYDAALARQDSQGTVINIPAQSGGQACTTSSAGGGIYWANTRAKDVQFFSPSDIDGVNSTLAFSNINEGQQLIFAGRFASLPGIIDNGARRDPIDDPAQCTGIIPGSVYYAHVFDSTHIQLSCKAQVSGGGKLMQFASTGAAGYTGAYQYVKYPRQLQWIIIRTETPDSQLPPADTRIGPQWAPKLAKLVNPYLGSGIIGTPSRGASSTLFNVDDTDGNNAMMTGKVWFKGLEMTVKDQPDWHTSSNPAPGGSVFTSSQFNSDIVLDQVYAHGYDAPGRQDRFMNWEGHNLAILNSYISDLGVFQPHNTGLGLNKTGASTFTLDAGAAHMNGESTYTQGSQITVTLSGTYGGGYGRVYSTIEGASSKLTVQLPTGMSATCTGGPCVVTNATANDGGCAIWAGGWPQNGFGHLGVGMIGCLAFNGDGTLNFTQNADTFSDTGLGTDGCQCVLATNGPGPITVDNVFFSGSGNIIHFADNNYSGPGGRQTPYIDKNDFYIHRSTWDTPPSMNVGSPNGGSALSNGLEYRNRNQLEWKAGNRIWVDGNIFQGGYRNVATAPLVFTPVCDQGITDVTVTNNIWRHTFAGLIMASSTEGGCIQGAPANRYQIENNLGYDINGYKYWDVFGGFAPGSGEFVASGYGEDFIINHNTWFNANGQLPVLWWMAEVPAEGAQVTNNIATLAPGDFINHGMGADGAANQDSPADVLGQAFADKRLVEPGNLIAGNLFTSTAFDAATIGGWWPNTSYRYIPSNPGDFAALGFVKYTGSDPAFSGDTQNIYQWKAGNTPETQSPYASGGPSPGADGKGVGVNMNRLGQAQGKVYFTSVVPASTTATVNFVAPDAQGCPVDVSTSDSTLVTTFTRTADAGGSAGPRSVSVSGLSAHTDYYFRIDCAVEQPKGTFHTN